LKKHMEIQVDVIDFNVILNKIQDFNFQDFYSLFEKYIKEYSENNRTPDYVGISALFTSSHNSILDLANISKKFFANSKCLVGGNYPTAMYAELLNTTESIDAICYGEGEKPLLNMLTATDFDNFIKNSESWIDKKKLNNPMRKLSHDFIVDLDEIPFYDYDCLDIEGYKLNPNSSRYAVKEKYKIINGDDIKEDIYAEDTIGSIKSLGNIGYSMPIMTSRGCPFKCTFCASHAAHGRDMRYHSLERVITDLKLMKIKYGIDGVVIQDDHFMAGKYRPYEIVKNIGELDLGMYFQNALAIYALDIEFLKLLKKSGVDSLVLPIESGSNRVLKELMKKPLRLDIVPRVLKDCREAGIFTDCNIILGMPGETHEDINDSREFLKTIYADWFRIFTAMPIAGSEMYDRCKKEGLFDTSELNANYKRSVISTESLTSEEVMEYTYLMNIELNFVYNTNIRLEKYDIALESFLNVIKVKEDHAIAHYYLGVCYDKLNRKEDSEREYDLAYFYASSDFFWHKYIEKFNIPIFNKKRNNEIVF